MTEDFKMPRYTNASGNRYTICPEGFHNFRIARAEERTSKNGNPYVLVAMDNTSIKSGYVWEIVLTKPTSPPINAKAIDFLQSRLSSFKSAVGMSGDIDCGQILNKKLSARIIHKPNEHKGGETEAKVQGTSFGEYDHDHEMAVQKVRADDERNAGKSGRTLVTDEPLASRSYDGTDDQPPF